MYGMQEDEAKILLGLAPHSHPSPSQVKAAYKTKVWDTHPDRFPPRLKSQAEHSFKLISEAYACLRSGIKQEELYKASYSNVVRSGVPRACGRGGNRALTAAPFFVIIMGTVALGGSVVSRTYKRQKEAYPSHNPFLP
ncbi:hypothetical protein ACH5RR_010888 [Cinchona calisaya]|uniref:J domain-containing protein n=1 Tax=Cinchona calisaya TaxID=153742 RepID=A0ABD3AK92_9GENT